jgi:hypothetical protein
MAKMSFFDLNLKSFKCHTLLLLSEEMAYEHWENGPLSIDGVPSPIRISRMCRSAPGQLQAHFFSCWDQFLYMNFAQLTYRESLRDIQACLRGNQQKRIGLTTRS